MVHAFARAPESRLPLPGAHVRASHARTRARCLLSLLALGENEGGRNSRDRDVADDAVALGIVARTISRSLGDFLRLSLPPRSPLLQCHNVDERRPRSRSDGLKSIARIAFPYTTRQNQNTRCETE